MMISKSLRTELRNKIKSSQFHFFNVKMHNFLSTNPRKFWMHLSNKKEKVTKIKINDADVTDASCIATVFNKYFCSVFLRMGDTPPEFHGNNLELPDLIISEEGVFSALLHLDTKKSAGPDEIPNAFFCRYAEWCSKYLVIIFRESLLQGEVPEEWKKAKLVPIYKSGVKYDVKNYRPISLLCTASKVMEHFLFKHVTSFLESNRFFSPNQHGFQQGFSTATQLIHTTDDFLKTLDKGGQIDAIFLDFEKAFNRVSHSHLMFKIRQILTNERIVRWLDSYLSNRYQHVKIADTNSPFAPVCSGVPQGSVLGPLLFLIYLNDMASEFTVRCRFFADDCIVCLSIQSTGDHITLSEYLSAVTAWCNSWKMSLNVAKCAKMTITRKKKTLGIHLQVQQRCYNSRPPI